MSFLSKISSGIKNLTKTATNAVENSNISKKVSSAKSFFKGAVAATLMLGSTTEAFASNDINRNEYIRGDDVHEVVSGDTMWDLSQKYGIPYNEFRSMNMHIDKPSEIWPGNILYLSSKNPENQFVQDNQVECDTYTVESGDVLYGIAAKNNISNNDIVAVNKGVIDDINFIYPGDVINLRCPTNDVDNTIVSDNNDNHSTEPAIIKEDTNLPSAANDEIMVSDDKNSIVPYISHNEFKKALKKEVKTNSDIQQVVSYYAEFNRKKSEDYSSIEDQVSAAVIDDKYFTRRVPEKQLTQPQYTYEFEDKVKEVLSIVGFNNLASKHILIGFARTESSGGEPFDDIGKYMKIADIELRNKKIKASVEKMIPLNDGVGDFQITSGYLDRSANQGLPFIGTVIKDHGELRERVNDAIIEAIENEKTIYEIKEVLGNIDVRFDNEQMGGIILGNFLATYNELGNLPEGLKVKMALLAHNYGKNFVLRKGKEYRKRYQAGENIENTANLPDYAHKLYSQLSILNIKGDLAQKKQNTETVAEIPMSKLLDNNVGNVFAGISKQINMMENALLNAANDSEKEDYRNRLEGLKIYRERQLDKMAA